MQHRLAYASVSSTTNATTSCKSLVKIDAATSAENSLESGNCAATRPQYDDRRSFGTLAFENRLKYWNFDFSRLIGNHFCTLYVTFINKKHLKNVGPIRHCEPPPVLILHCHSPGVATVDTTTKMS